MQFHGKKNLHQVPRGHCAFVKSAKYVIKYQLEFDPDWKQTGTGFIQEPRAADQKVKQDLKT